MSFIIKCEGICEASVSKEVTTKIEGFTDGSTRGMGNIVTCHEITVRKHKNKIIQGPTVDKIKLGEIQNDTSSRALYSCSDTAQCFDHEQERIYKNIHKY